MREIRTLRAMWRALETGLRQLLNGHEEGNLGYKPRRNLRATAPVLDPTTQFQEFSVNLGCTPSCILFRHLADQGSNLCGDLRPATAPSRMPAPVETETSTMPADDSLGFDNLEDIHPAGPATRQGSPEEPVQGVQRRPRSLCASALPIAAAGRGLRARRRRDPGRRPAWRRGLRGRVRE